jgi:ketosteroid isomerase-like protein
MSYVELIPRGFEAFDRGDVESVLQTLHPDVEVHTSAEAGDDRNVRGHANQWGRGRDSGVRVDRAVIFLVTVQAGLTTRIHIYADRDTALAAIPS